MIEIVHRASHCVPEHFNDRISQETEKREPTTCLVPISAVEHVTLVFGKLGQVSGLLEGHLTHSQLGGDGLFQISRHNESMLL